MPTKLNLERLPGEIADRARAVFSAVVKDLDKLISGLGKKLGPGAAPPRAELLRLIGALRKSLDARLSALENAIAGPARKKAAKPAKKAARKSVAGKAAKKSVARKPKPAVARKSTKAGAARRR